MMEDDIQVTKSFSVAPVVPCAAGTLPTGRPIR
jgi:hypothetical protein